MKKIIAVVLLAALGVFSFFSVQYIMDSDLFKSFPEAEYLSEDEAAGNVMYNTLNKKEKAVYTALYRGIIEHKKHIDLPFDIEGEMYEKIYTILEKQESELFYIDYAFYVAEKIRRARIDFNTNEKETASKMLEIEKKRDKILADVDKKWTAEEKAKYIHDYLTKNCRYVIEYNRFNGTAYGCLVEGEARCEGYAKAFDYLMEALGVRTVVITGTTDEGEAHAWNKFEGSDGKWYNVDVTWDDNDGVEEGNHCYFMSSSEAFYKTHTPNDVYADENLIFNSKEYSGSGKNYYYKMNKLYATDEEDAEEILAREIADYNEQKKYMEIEFADSKLYDKFIKKYFTDGEIVDVIAQENPELIKYEKYNSFSIMENKDENIIVFYPIKR